MTMPAVVGGAVLGAVAASAVDEVKDRAGEALNGPMPDHGPVEMTMLVDLVAEIHKVIRDAVNVSCAPKDEKVLLQSNAGQQFRLNRRGYKHVSLLSPVNFNIICQTEIGIITFSMQPGWNALDLPDATLLSVANNTQMVILHFSDYSLDIAGV